MQQDQQLEAPPGSSAQPTAKRPQPEALAGNSLHSHPGPSDMHKSHTKSALMSNSGCHSKGCSVSFSLPKDSLPQTHVSSADEGEDTLARALKRPRLVWTPKLHQRFIEAVEQLGLKVAVPKTIMQVLPQPHN